MRKITDTLTENEGIKNVLVNLEFKEGVVMYDGMRLPGIHLAVTVRRRCGSCVSFLCSRAALW